jgi:hypothetical protein
MTKYLWLLTVLCTGKLYCLFFAKIAFVYFTPPNFVNCFLFIGTAAERREYYGQLLGPLVDTVPGVGGQVGSCCVPCVWVR